MRTLSIHPSLRRLLLGMAAIMLLTGTGWAQAQAPVYYRLRQGVTFYVVNPRGAAFSINLELKDINTFCQGEQTALFKVYDPNGAVLHGEDLPDDGITDGGYDQGWAGWDHELWARGTMRSVGAEPLFRADAFSNPRKLEKITGVRRTVAVPGGAGGVYQIQLAGCDDHFVKLQLTPNLKFGVLGHPDFFAGHGDQFRTAYLYVPELPFYCAKEQRLDLWVIEHGYPRTRKLSLWNGAQPMEMTLVPQKTTATTLTPGQAFGRAQISLKDVKPGTVLKLVNEGTGDYLLRVHGIPAILCPDEETARAIAGGVTPLKDGPVVTFPFQRKLWDAVKGLKKEDFVTGLPADAWHTIPSAELQKIGLFPWAGSQSPSGVNKALAKVEAALKAEPFTLLAFFNALDLNSSDLHDLTLFYRYPFKGNGLYQNLALRNIITLGLVKQWLRFRGGEVIFAWGELNVAYSHGFHWDYWEQIWNMKEALDPAVLAAFQEGAARIAERTFYANALEVVISNGRTTVPMNIYHAYLITGDPKLKALSLRHLRRMTTALDGPHSGQSPTGYFREHFTMDGGYCTYPLFQLGRMYRLSKEPEVLAALDRLSRWICYVTFPDQGRWTGPTSWNGRIAMAASEHIWGNGYVYFADKSEWAARLYRHFNPRQNMYDVPDPLFDEGKPVPDKNTLLLTHLTRNVLPAQPMPADMPGPFFTDVGDGGELFAIRRGQYYALVYAGKRNPFWMDTALGGVGSFTGGGLAGLYMPGVGSVILGRVNKGYGWPQEGWQEMTVPVAVGEMTDGRIFNTGVSRIETAPDAGAWRIRTVGECVTVPVNFTRSYTFGETEIAATISVRNAEMETDVFQYRTIFRKGFEPTIKSAWEMVPVKYAAATKITCFDAGGNALGALTETAIDHVSAVEINQGKGGVRLKFDAPRTVRLNHPCKENRLARAVLVKIADAVGSGEEGALSYTITPFTK